MKKEVLDKIAALITAALGLAAALAWNDAIREIFRRFLGDSTTITAMLTYAIVITIIAVAATIKIGQLAEKAKKEDFFPLVSSKTVKRRN